MTSRRKSSRLPVRRPPARSATFGGLATAPKAMLRPPNRRWRGRVGGMQNELGGRGEATSSVTISGSKRTRSPSTAGTGVGPHPSGPWDAGSPCRCRAAPPATPRGWPPARRRSPPVSDRSGAHVAARAAGPARSAMAATDSRGRRRRRSVAHGRRLVRRPTSHHADARALFLSIFQSVKSSDQDDQSCGMNPRRLDDVRQGMRPSWLRDQSRPLRIASMTVHGRLRRFQDGGRW